MKILALLLVVPIFVTTPSLAAEERQPQVSHWVESAATKVFKDSPAGPKREIELFAARGEWESAQVVLRGEGDVSLEMTEMTGLEGSQALPAGWAEVRRVAYIPVPYVPKDFPDPLRPMIATNSPTATSRSMPFSARVAVDPWP